MCTFFSTGDVSGIALTVLDFPPGDYILTTEVRDVDGNTGVETTAINLSGVYLVVSACVPILMVYLSD